MISGGVCLILSVVFSDKKKFKPGRDDRAWVEGVGGWFSAPEKFFRTGLRQRSERPRMPHG